MMRKQLAAIAFVAFMWSDGIALAGECNRVVVDGVSAVVDGAGNKVRYGFVPQDKRWMVFPFGWHATAQISCENCNSEDEIGAYAWLSVDEAGGWGFVSDDEAEFMKLISSMWFSGYQGEAPVADGDPEELRWNGFTGHARRFVGLSKDGQKRVLIGAWLTDGCASVRLYTSVGRVEAASPLAYLRPLLDGVSIERR